MLNVTTKSIETIRAEAKAAVQAKILAAKEAAEVSLLTNEAFQDAQVKQALRDQTTEKLTFLIDQCNAIVESNPIVNRKLKQERTFNISKRYGLGNQFALLSGLLSGIQYSVQEHASLMLEITGLSIDLIETTLQHLGHAQALMDNVLLIESILGITLDKSLIKQANLDRQHEIALAKAEKVQAEMELAATVQQFIIN
jgi:hypothetical protein